MTWYGSRILKSNGSKSANGYILEPALILFSFVLLFSTWSLLCVHSRSALIQASKRSSLDLAILEKAKEKAGDLSWRRRCGMEEMETATTEIIQNHTVQFRDHTTYLQTSYQEEGRTFSMFIYYDESGLIKVEYKSEK